MKNTFLFICISFLLLKGCTNNEVVPASFNLPDHPTHVLKPVFEINSVDRNSFFKSLLMTYPLSNGNILIRNANSSKIYEINQEGEVVGKVGAQGRGPGEFSKVSRLIVLPDNRIHIFDRGNGRQSIFKKKGDNWHLLRSYEFKNKISGLRAQLPVLIVDTLQNGYKGVFQISPSSSMNDTLSKVYAYTAKIDENLQNQEDPKYDVPVSDILISEGNGNKLFSWNPRFSKAFYLYDQTRNQFIYIKNTDNTIYEIEENGEKNKAGYLPFDKFPVDQKKVEESLKDLSTFYPSVVEEEKDKILRHEPFFEHIKLINDELWLNLSRSDSTKPNFISTTVTGKVKRAFFIQHRLDVIQASDTLIVAKVKKNNQSYIVGYELAEI